MSSMAAEVTEPSVSAIRMGSGALRIPRATRTKSSGDLDLSRYHSQELMQHEKEGSKVLMQGGAQVVSQPYATLNNGNKIPLVGLGTFKSTDEVMDEAVKAALRYGVRHIDCAEHYGNEPPIGRALQKAFTAGFAKREDIFITSKLWNTDHKAEDVRPALMKSLRDLQVDYLDLYLIHWPVTEPQIAGDEINPPLSETWEAMERLVDEGLVKNIGVSNSSIKCIQKLLKTARIKPQVNQVEIHPFWRNDELREFCKSQDIHVSAYCPLGTPYTSAKAVIRRAQSVSSHPLVRKMAEKYQKHVLSLLLRWGIQRENSVLAKSSNPHHIRGNLEGCLGWRISDQDMHKLSTIEFQLRLVDGIRFLRPEGPFRNMDEMWDDTYTEECRKAFINRMYKFPANPTFKLNNGAEMPVLGLGTWKNQQVSNTVQRALRRGFRHVDCSSQPDNEEEIGEAMEQIFSDWIVNRPDVFVTAKLQETEASKIPEAVAALLKRLRTDYVDLLLLPADQITGQDKMEEGWKAMEKIAEAGHAKSIGLISASMRQISSIMSFCTIKPAVNSIETHPACRNDRILHYCLAKGIHVMASSWPATAYMLHRKDAPAVLSAPAVVEVARKLGKHPSQILIRWAIQHGHSVSPKACTDVHLQGILDVLNWQMPEDDYIDMCQLPQEAPKKNLEDLEASFKDGDVKVLENFSPPEDEKAS